ncbi:MAG: retropepsin-like aspartic protease [Nitrospirota bacterium]
MKKICRQILVGLVMCCMLTPVFAGDRGSRFFSNRALGKYNKTNSRKSSEKPVIEDSAKTSEPAESSNDNEQQELKRYGVRYAGVARRIIIPVTFNNSITVPMLLDTGAPGMHISVRLAEKLGILDNDQGKLWIRTGGIGGSTPAILTIIETIQVGEIEDRFIPTVISPSMFTGFEGLIGMDFMGNYSLKVDTVNRRIIFEELPESTSMPAGHDEIWWRSTFQSFRSMKDAWKQFRHEVSRESMYTSNQKRMKSFVEYQYGEADDLFNRLNVYASEHSVPLEWR